MPRFWMRNPTHYILVEVSVHLYFVTATEAIVFDPSIDRCSINQTQKLMKNSYGYMEK